MNAIDDLVSEFSRLPGIGRKTAIRLTYWLLRRPPEVMIRLARAVDAVAERVRPCSVCGNLAEEDPCVLCTSPRRDRSAICVVEEASDIGAVEGAGEFQGLYHVLGGRLSPLEGVGPEDLNISSLLERVREGKSVREIIVATNASVEGEATAVYLQRAMKPLGIRVTRLARGLPMGGDLEYADGVTIAQAFSGRREL